MSLPLLDVEFHCSEADVARIAFSGIAGVGSAGNQHGDQIRKTIHELVAEHKPKAVVIDLRKLDYQFGNWIGCFLQASVSVHPGPACIVATGQTTERMRGLWDPCGLSRSMPILETLEEAHAYVEENLQNSR